MQKVLLAGFGSEFLNKANEVCNREILENPRNGVYYGITAINELKRLPRVLISTKYLLCAHNKNCNFELIESEDIITCGMSEKSDLSLSSVGLGDEKKATLTISRPIILDSGSTAIAQEVPLELQQGLTLYENIVLVGIKLICGNFDVLLS